MRFSCGCPRSDGSPLHDLRPASRYHGYPGEGQGVRALLPAGCPLGLRCKITCLLWRFCPLPVSDEKIETLKILGPKSFSGNGLRSCGATRARQTVRARVRTASGHRTRNSPASNGLRSRTDGAARRGTDLTPASLAGSARRPFFRLLRTWPGNGPPARRVVHR